MARNLQREAPRSSQLLRTEYFIGGIGDKTANVQAMGASFEVELSDTVSEPLTLTLV
jgi:hypothetical protein